uniref:VWFD domain-containing protein n=1 Tax=Eptatretus burgeri TaxID=7764 RepID=A0A8C4QC60_EPTBU
MHPGETWEKDCMVYTCMVDGTVKKTHKQCPPNHGPTQCANGLTPVSFTDDGCCSYTYCNCLCQGWGDPHYSTFDGTYYSHMGNCTYVLVEERYVELDYAVYVTNYDCGRDVSCPGSINVVYKSEEVKVTVPDKNDLTTKLVTVDDDEVGVPYKDSFFLVENFGDTIIVVVPDLNATVFFNGVFFEIYLPHKYFYNNTQGQCGTCTQNKTDDCLLRNGTVVIDCNALGPDWVTNTTDDCAERPPQPTTECPPSKICDIIYSSVFDGCREVLDFSIYYKSCQYDACYGGDTVCASLELIAETCNMLGFCIDWRGLTNGVCNYDCPSDMVYLPCAYEPQYCQK